MWSIVGLLLIVMVISAIEVPSLWKLKQRKEIAVLFVLLSIGFTLSSLLALDVNLPPILEGVKFVYKPVSDFVFNLLK